MTKRGEPADNCRGCGQMTPLRDLYVLRAGAYCNRCSRGGGTRAVQPRTYGPPAACADNRFDDARVVDLRRRGEELRRAGEVADRAQRLAYHESGHAVVAYALGIPLRRVEIDVHGGAGITERTATGGELWNVHDAACWLYGGQVAEVARFGFSRGAVDDDAVLHGLREVSRGGELDQAHAQARDLIGRHWNAVQALAGALLTRRSLDSYDVETVLAGRMRRGTEQRDASARSSAVTVDRRALVAEAGRVDAGLLEEIRGVDFGAELAEVARRSGVSVAAAQEAFNARCRRKYDLEHRSAERTYAFRQA